jgi:GntR family transcriptional regulator
MAESAANPLTDLPITPVDPDSPVPLYYQIEEDLRRLIRTGKISAQNAMPPELELCRAYGVGRHTMRMALARLVADKLIARRAGRGTFIKPQPDRMKFYLDRSFTRQMAELGHQAHSRVLALSLETITEDSPEVFHFKLGALCLRLVRLRLGDEEPIGLQASLILTELCPDLEGYDFTRQSLYDILARDYHLVITEIQHTVSAVTADEGQAQLLQISPGDPLLVVNTTTFLRNHQVIEYTTSYYRADKYEYSTTHTYDS